MEKAIKMDISKLYNRRFAIQRYECLKPDLENLYNFYLTNKNIELQYNNMNLLDYIEKERAYIYETDSQEEYEEKMEKALKKSFIKKCIFNALISLSITGAFIFSDDAYIQEKSKVANTYAMMEYLGEDTNNDGIKEIHTEIINDLQPVSKPTDEPFYKNSNFLYGLSDDLKIADNRSFIIAMNALGVEAIEYDDIVYSNTGMVTVINYSETIGNMKENVVATSLVFDNEEDVYNFIKNKMDPSDMGIQFSINSYRTFSCSTLEEIPSLYKNKEDGKIRLENPNAISQGIASRIIK